MAGRVLLVAPSCHSRECHLVSGAQTANRGVRTMKIFVAGATGAIGGHLIPQLVAHGHEVVGMTRSESKADVVRALGARPVIADGLDADAVAQAVAAAEPEAIIHQL